MKKFFKELDYSFVLLILYIIKSVALPAAIIDVCIVGILAAFCLGRFIANIYSNTKLKYANDQLDFRRFKLVEEMAAKEKVLSENDFRKQVNEALGKLDHELSAIKLGQGFGKGLGGKR
jgi:hypothetical protein